jgi:segregation and condensation protein B
MELKLIAEAILFSAQKPLSLKEIRDVFAAAPEHAEGDETVRTLKKVKEQDLQVVLEQLAREHEVAQRAFHLVCVAGSWQFVTQPGYVPWLKALVGHKARPPRLSQPALETLAIIAYRQPVTRAELEQVRGVAVDGVVQTLLERGLIQPAGRAEIVGHPMTYGTTAAFLEYFGLRSLEDLPAADELRKVVTTKPATLATAEPGLATAPPEQLTLLAEGAKPEPPSSEPAGAQPPAGVSEATLSETRETDGDSDSLPAPDAEPAVTVDPGADDASAQLPSP